MNLTHQERHQTVKMHGQVTFKYFCSTIYELFLILNNRGLINVVLTQCCAFTITMRCNTIRCYIIYCFQ
jgi:hypothetical protein